MSAQPAISPANWEIFFFCCPPTHEIYVRVVYKKVKERNSPLLHSFEEASNHHTNRNPASLPGHPWHVLLQKKPDEQKIHRIYVGFTNSRLQLATLRVLNLRMAVHFKIVSWFCSQSSNTGYSIFNILWNSKGQLLFPPGYGGDPGGDQGDEYVLPLCHGHRWTQIHAGSVLGEPKQDPAGSPWQLQWSQSSSEPCSLRGCHVSYVRKSQKPSLLRDHGTALACLRMMPKNGWYIFSHQKMKNL